MSPFGSLAAVFAVAVTPALASEPALVLAGPGKIVRLQVVANEDTDRAWARGRALLIHADCPAGLVWRHRRPRYRLTTPALDGVVLPTDPTAWHRSVSPDRALVLATWTDALCPSIIQPDPMALVSAPK